MLQIMSSRLMFLNGRVMGKTLERNNYKLIVQ